MLFKIVKTFPQGLRSLEGVTKITPSEKVALENFYKGNGQIDFINRPEKVGKAKRTLPSAKQMVFQSKIKLQGFINLAGGLWYKIEYYKLFTIC